MNIINYFSFLASQVRANLITYMKIVLCQTTELHEGILQTMRFYYMNIFAYLGKMLEETFQTMRFRYMFGKIHPAEYGPLICLTVPSPLKKKSSQISL